MLKGCEDAVSTDNSAKVATLQTASDSGVASAPVATKQPLPFVQVTMNDYIDDDLPATVIYTISWCITLKLRIKSIILISEIKLEYKIWILKHPHKSEAWSGKNIQILYSVKIYPTDQGGATRHTRHWWGGSIWLGISKVGHWLGKL